MAFEMSFPLFFGPVLPRESLNSNISGTRTWATNFIAMATKFQVEVVVECFPPFPVIHQHNTLESPCLNHLRRQRVSTMYHGSLISLYLCLQIVTGAFQIQGPHEPMVAMLGGDAELRCLLLPHQSVKNMKISWTRFLPSQVVHLYEDGRDKPEEAHEEYFGRTELVTDYMDKGAVTLRILNVQPSDSGQYRCAFQHGSFYSDAIIMLKMEVLGSRPQLHVEVTKSSQFQIECKSEGWFPQPKVQWMDSEGEEIPAESETHTLDEGGLFHVTTSLLLREPPQKNLTCSIWNPVLNQKKEERLSTEGQFSLPLHYAHKMGLMLTLHKGGSSKHTSLVLLSSSHPH
ncbi:putative selection and upkeep of intraepithelial T-cells protein 1 homolog [Myotis myotis]|uniref:putative selection and upkeep of intraepithelial T-cells protein 1 homolog n=1 Tax=Myotis myotis TaxID=51298 RepID=UPI001748CBB5|nr:putative selection and upkeep of intraepithelial T-cells protein 1 homolog [Myotis myotis]